MRQKVTAKEFKCQECKKKFIVVRRFSNGGKSKFCQECAEKRRKHQKKLLYLKNKLIKGATMTVGEFAVRVAEKEGKKEQVSIAQIKEILKIVNKEIDGKLYRIIRSL